MVDATISYLALMNIENWIDPNAPYLPTVVVALVVVVQSLFGVGVLFLGTPVLMLMGLPMLEILRILHPISISVNAIQTVIGWRHIQWKMVKSFVVFALPMTVLGTLLLKSLLGAALLPVLIAFYLGLVAIGFYFQAFPHIIQWAMKRDVLYLLLMGLIHGLTNLGGPLLSSFVLARFSDKEQARATTATCYGLLVIIQLLTLTMTGTNLWFTQTNLLQIGIAILVFALTNAFVFHRMSNQKFRLFFGCLLILMSILLLLR